MKVTAMFRNSTIALAGVFLLATALPALADGPQRVARLTFVSGYVHIDMQDRTPGDPATGNMPLIEGQSIVTGQDGQAEVEFEDGSVARVTPNSALVLARLGGSGDTFDTRLALAHGLAFFELRSAPRWQYTVEAAGDLIVPVENTTFRVNLDEAPAAIAVLTGTAHVERRESYSLDVGSGETLRSDIAHAGRYFLTEEIAADTWDQWNESRDQAAADAAAVQTPVREGVAGTQGYGWSDLDANGNWYDVAGGGKVWQPAGGDIADFDPYANGNWIWYPRTGYLWASNYSWGWTPFRCGSWSYWDGFGWGWSPNIGCGGYGFAGYGGNGYGYGSGGGVVFINVVQPPRGYPVHRIPPGSGGVHPIIRVGSTFDASRPRPILQPGAHRIAGVVATPILPAGRSYTSRGGSAVGSSLQRDFPVERTTRTPVLGLQPDPNRMHTGFVASPGFAPVGPAAAAATPSGSLYGRPSQPQPGLRPAPLPAQGIYPHPSAPGTVQPTYHAPTPTAQHIGPSVSQPVAPPTSHPVYSQPPAPVHYAPQPQHTSAPAPPAPHVSATAPAATCAPSKK